MNNEDHNPEESKLFNPSFIKHLSHLVNDEESGKMLLYQWQIEAILEALRPILPLMIQDEIKEEYKTIMEANIRALNPAVKAHLPLDMGTFFGHGTDIEGMRDIVRYSTWNTLLGHLLPNHK